MGTLTSLFDLTRGALGADQAALSATANNVANQNTVGYTRQLVSWQSGDSVTLGSGVSSAPQVTIRSVRDRVLEQRVQQGTQQQSATGARAAVLAQVENVFSLTGNSATAGSTQIGTAIDSFFSSLTALAGNPTDGATAQGVIAAAGVLAGAFHAAAGGLATISKELNGEIGISVSTVNGLTKTIAALNLKIAQESPHADAGTLEDQRQQAISQLSQYVGLNQIATENGGITLTTEGGAVLVSGQKASGLSAATTASGTTEILDASGVDVSAGIECGSIGGQLAAQKTDLPAVASALDALAYRVATAVNGQNLAGAGGTAIFTAPTGPAGAAAGIAVAVPATVASAAAGEGASGNTNANALADLANGVDGSGQTISGSLGAMLAQVGTSSAGMQEQNTVEQASLAQLTTQRNGLSAVSLNEEASNLSTYQRSYEAGAKLLSVLDTLMAAAINIGTETAVV